RLHANSTRDRFAARPNPVSPTANAARAQASSRAPAGSCVTNRRAAGTDAPASSPAPSHDTSTAARVEAAAAGSKPGVPTAPAVTPSDAAAPWGDPAPSG